MLFYSTYLGGSSTDRGAGIAVDAAGNAYVTGITDSADFPTTMGAFQTAVSGTGDFFVTKLNPTGTALVYSTYLGGSGSDSSPGIAVDAQGNAYVAGFTGGTDFPTTEGAFQTAITGSNDVFVTKLNPDGSALVYSTLLGGSRADVAFGLAVDAAGNAYVAGWTESTNFPTTAGAFQTSFGGNRDAFVTKLNLTGSARVYSTYLGGSTLDQGRAIAVDAQGSAYVTGFTGSTDFPTTPGAFQTTPGPGAFVTKVNPSGTGLVYSTYLGGHFLDTGIAIAVDALPSPNAYVTGSSGSGNFPTTAGAFQTTASGGSDAFVAKIVDITLPPGATSGEVSGGGSIDASSGMGSFGFDVPGASGDGADQRRPAVRRSRDRG